MNITVLDGFALNPGDLSWEALRKLGNLTVYDRTSPENVVERSRDSEIILTNKTRLDGETLLKLPKLKYIGVLATGYNVVDIETARNLGITVTNIPAYSTMSVAQKVFALLLSITDRTEHYAMENRNGKWSKSLDFCYTDTPLIELDAKTFGIVGLGNIGMAVARIASAFGMKVMAFTSKRKEDLPEGIEKADFDTLLAVSDVISLHCPLTESTLKLIDEKALSKMKPTAILINTGRGPLVDEAAVAKALREGRLGAFGADVLSTEPPVKENPLLSAPNSFITPHIAWATLEARERLMDMAVENVRKYLDGKPVNVVN